MKNEIKKAIYVSLKEDSIVEKIARENNIIFILRLTNSFNITSLVKENLRSLNDTQILVLDLQSVLNSSENKEIIDNLIKLRELSELERIVIIARGFRKGNVLLAKCVDLGIYNIVTADNDNEYIDQLNIVFSDKGMTFGQASSFRIDNLSLNLQGRTSQIIQTYHDRVRQDVSIGIIGVNRGIGTTTWAFNVANFLNSITNITAALIEANDHHDIEDVGKILEYEGCGIENLPNAKEVRIKGIDCFYDLSKMGDITAKDYNFYIYDYGSIDENDEVTFSTFLNKDVKFIISGSKPWEQKYLFKIFEKLGNTNKENFYFIYNFTKESERNSIKKQMEDLNVFFNEYQPDFLELKSESFLNNILTRFISGISVEEQEKKKKFDFNLSKMFKRN